MTNKTMIEKFNEIVTEVAQLKNLKVQVDQLQDIVFDEIEQFKEEINEGIYELKEEYRGDMQSLTNSLNKQLQELEELFKNEKETLVERIESVKEDMSIEIQEIEQLTDEDIRKYLTSLAEQYPDKFFSNRFIIEKVNDYIEGKEVQSSNWFHLYKAIRKDLNSS